MSSIKDEKTSQADTDGDQGTGGTTNKIKKTRTTGNGNVATRSQGN